MFYNASKTKQQTECMKLIFKTKLYRTYQQTMDLIQLHSTDVNEDYRLAAPPKNINIPFMKFFKIFLTDSGGDGGACKKKFAEILAV